MAWLRPLIKCGCGKPAIMELLGRQNESYGRFCKKCGERRLKELLETEKAEKAAEVQP